MKKLVAIIAIVASQSAFAHYECFDYLTKDHPDFMKYKVKVAKAKHGESVIVSGVAYKEGMDPLFVQGSALRLADGHHNIYLNAITSEGAIYATVSIKRANYPGYGGVYSQGLSHVVCDDFPETDNL